MATAQEIMREERDATLAALAALPLPSQAREDVLAVCAVVQEAINSTVAALDRPIDPRIGPAALRLMADEIERLNKRFVAAGLAAPLN